ncbi:MAG: AAA family ATPase [Oscillatoriaceae cyanobacterium]
MTPYTNIDSPSLPEISGYAIIEQLYLGSRTAVYRAMQTAQQRSVAIKVLRREYPSFGELVQFRNQYTIAKNLPIPGIVQPLSLEPLGNGYALVMDDWGGVSLEQYLQHQSLDLTEVLAIAVQIADILHDLHQHRVVHKDIKPANILIHPKTKQVKLIDFSIASLLPKETQEIQSPNVLEGTLSYLAPEQTGRMNRGIDYRADFYALGVTLYQLLSGKLPFESKEPLELIHCHIAKVPVPLELVNPAVPGMVAAIVSKLMGKNAEDRYQSAKGLKHDLDRCVTQWQATGKIQTFALGTRDLSDRFNIPEKLYGRDAEVQTLLDAFERVAQGSAELMLVAGFSGIGKTAVVNEVHKPITRQNGYFIKGKFDQFNRNIPLSAFVQAFRDLIGHLLSESDTQLAQWKAQILEAVGESGQVLIEVIPELEHIIGKQPPAPELSGSSAQNRFNLLFQKFIQVFTTPEHPLVIFLDDLQWADLASLQLMKLLINHNGYLLMLGAYRDNEVSPVHPLMLAVEELTKAQAIIHTITLKPLAIEHTNYLIADTLRCSQELALPLTQLVERKTKGNPFFTTQFLKALHEDGYMTFNGDRRYWECDIAQINALTLTDDVVEFMAVQLQKLPAETQQVLKLAACVGNHFDLATLAIISEQSPTEAATALWKALQEGFILPTTQVYKFFQSEENDSYDVLNNVNPTYRFLHDRVQQAAYSLIDRDKKQSTHLTIGQLLQQKLSATEQEERLFDIVGHLNLGQELLTQREERDALARYNLAAAQKAKSSTSYATARNFVVNGLNLLADNCWQEQYELSLNLHVAAAEVAYLNGYFEEMNCRAQQVLDAAKTVLDKVEVYVTQINSLTAQNQMAEAIALGANALAQLGVNLSHQAARSLSDKALQDLGTQLQGREIEDLVNLPMMNDPQTIAAMKLLAILFTPIFVIDPTLFPLLCSQMVSLSLQFGNTAVSTIGYVGYGIVLRTFCGEVERGYRFGKMAWSLLARLNAPEYKALAVLYFSTFLQHHQEPMQAMMPLLKEGYLSGMETGNFLEAGHDISSYFEITFFSGLCLGEWEPEMEHYRIVLEQVKQDHPVTYIKMKQQVVQNLVVNTSQPDVLIGTAYDEAKMLPQYLQDQEFIGIGLAYIFKLVLAYLFGNITRALEYIDRTHPYLSAVSGFVHTPAFHFYAGLTYLIVAITQSDSEQSHTLTLAEQHQATLSQWAHYAPMNHKHKVDLLEAEKCRVLGKRYEASDLYDRAIAGAKENGFVQEEALANELAAKFYLDWGKEKIAQEYLTNAYYGYARWGAKAKVEDLGHRYPQMLAPVLLLQNNSLSSTETVFAPELLTASPTQSSSSSGSGSAFAALDLATVLKASQTLFSEIQLDRLLATLLQTVLENAGADKAALLLSRDQQWFVEAVAIVDQPAKIQSVPLSESLDLPLVLIQNVKRNLQPVVIVDAVVHPTLATNAYIVQQQPKSILCTPILQQGKLIAILYLENRLTAGAFTSDRVALLQILASQAAISLENARLYQEISNYSHKLEAEVQRKTEDLSQKAADLEEALQNLQQTQLQLIQSEKMSALGQLVAGIAHEINNPVTFIQTNLHYTETYLQDLLLLLELYQQEYPAATPQIQAKIADIELEFIWEDLTKILRSMKVGSERIQKIVLSLRNFSRLDEAEMKAVDLHAGIDNTLLILQNRCQGSESQPQVEVIKNYGNLPEVMCYASEMNQVFLSIINNALDALQEVSETQKNPQIKIQTEVRENSWVRITIADNGCGISPEIQKRMFEPFFTTKPVGSGTGLGLSVSYAIVKKHGGELTCDSTVSIGTKFLINIPINPFLGIKV